MENEEDWWDGLLGGISDVAGTGVDILKSWTDYENYDWYREFQTEQQRSLIDPYGNTPLTNGTTPYSPRDYWPSTGGGLGSNQIITYGLVAAGAILLIKALK
ncbi:MAG: hypothetical protein P8P30_02000 [Rickettsiales bacterium]|nr:hypothetical protein [Rickettsiales bacterium]